MSDQVKGTTVAGLITDQRETDLPKTATVLVGVYGTLKRNFFRNPSLGEGRQYIGELGVSGYMFHEGGHPALIEAPEGHPWHKQNRVYCQVWRINTQQLIVLDNIENHPYYYQRKQVSSDMFGEPVWVYFICDEMVENYFTGPQELIPHSVWNGPHTKSVKVDFLDGIKKPKIMLGNRHIYASEINKMDRTAEIDGCIVDAETGEIQRLNVALTAPSTAVTTTTPKYPGMIVNKHRDYTVKTYRDGAYYNENGEKLAYCEKERDHVLQGTEWSHEDVWKEKMKALEPTAITVELGGDIISTLKPKTATL